MSLSRKQTSAPRPKIDSLKIFVVGLLGSLILRLINCTLRWKTIGLDGEKKYWPHHKPILLVFWHGDQLLMPWIYRNGRRNRDCPPISALISEHRDGRLVARAMQFLGIQSVAGSSSHGGREAIFNLIDKLKSGSHVAITPDGPKGPRHKLKSGVIKIAQRAQVEIYPAAITFQNKWTFRSWDQMTLPKPFSRAVMSMGEPINVPEKITAEELEHYTVLVENSLKALRERGELFFDAKREKES